MIDVEYEDRKAAESRLNQPIKAPDDTVYPREEPRETLGDYCKGLEKPYTTGVIGTVADTATDIRRVLIPKDEHCIIRVDGRAFHTFTRPYKTKDSPFCIDIIKAMRAAIDSLIGEFSPAFVYSQSDEITVVIEPHKVPFGRRCHKLNSIAASVATAAFNLYLARNGLARTTKPATFDARAYGASREDVGKVLIWRQRDAIKNSISAVARTVYSSKQLESRNSDEKLSMMAEKGVRWEDYPRACTHGMIAFRTVKQVVLDPNWLREQGTPEGVIDKIVGEGCIAMRNVTEYPDVPRFDRLANLDSVIFEHAEPLFKQTKETNNEDI